MGACPLATGGSTISGRLNQPPQFPAVLPPTDDPLSDFYAAQSYTKRTMSASCNVSFLRYAAPLSSSTPFKANQLSFVVYLGSDLIYTTLTRARSDYHTYVIDSCLFDFTAVYDINGVVRVHKSVAPPANTHYY